MNWKKGFKRITNVVAIVIAVACGVIAVYLPIHWRNDATELSMDRFSYFQEATWYELGRRYGMSSDDYRQLQGKDVKLPDGKSPVEEFRLQFHRYIEHERNKCFWYRLSTNELIGMIVLCGLGGVVAGYVGTWAVLWYGGLAIFVFIHWLVLGFREDKPANEQNNK